MRYRSTLVCTMLSAAVMAGGVAARGLAAAPTTQPTSQPTTSFSDIAVAPTTEPDGPELIGATPTTARVLDADAIRVGIYNGTGGRPLGNGEGNVARCLIAGGQFDFRLITAEQIKAGVLNEVDVLVQSGCGNGGGQAKALEADGRDAIKKFVARGGGYVGICAGAYLATSEYPWSLHLINAKLVDPAHWARGNGEVKVTFNDAGKLLLNLTTATLPMRFAQGPVLTPADEKDLPAYEPLAQFETEISDKDVPANKMTGATAAATATYDHGRVILISPHPEATAGNEGMVRRAVSWAAKRVVD